MGAIVREAHVERDLAYVEKEIKEYRFVVGLQIVLHSSLANRSYGIEKWRSPSSPTSLTLLSFPSLLRANNNLSTIFLSRVPTRIHKRVSHRNSSRIACREHCKPSPHRTHVG